MMLPTGGHRTDIPKGQTAFPGQATIVGDRLVGRLDTWRQPKVHQSHIRPNPPRRLETLVPCGVTDALPAPGPLTGQSIGKYRDAYSGGMTDQDEGVDASAPATPAAAPRTRQSAKRTRPLIPAISVVVPTRNEAANVTPLWDRLREALDGIVFEVCFVDDSDDATASLLARLEAAEAPRVRCLFRTGSDRAGGLTTAVIAGLRMATGRYVCVMDGDLQHPPETIPRLLAAAQGGADLVVASRYVQGASAAGLAGGMRRMVSKGATGLARLLFSEARQSKDPLSGFFLCRRELIDGIEFRPVGFKVLLELLVCVPDLEVRDVPLSFAARAGGESKATVRQGLLYLRHLASLFFAVDGSARFWKFAMVGSAGLAIFLSLLALGTGPLHLAPTVAFFPAYLPSLAWNLGLNHRWTFADQHGKRVTREPLRYAQRVILSGLSMFLAYEALIALHLTTVFSGLLAALLAMALNGVINRRAVRQRPDSWGRVSTDRAVQSALAALAMRIGADRAYILPARGYTAPAGVPAAVIEHLVTHRRGTIWTEAASHRAQRRTNIDLTSMLLLPVVHGGDVFGVVVCERRRPRGYPERALETAMRGLETLAPLLTNAAGVPPARREDRLDQTADPAPISAAPTA